MPFLPAVSAQKSHPGSETRPKKLPGRKRIVYPRREVIGLQALPNWDLASLIRFSIAWALPELKHFSRFKVNTLFFRSRENIASSAGLSETSFSSSANTTLTPDTSGNAGNSSSGSTYHTARPATVVSGGGGSNNSSVLQVHSSSNNSSLNNSASSNSHQQGINRTTSVPTPLGNNPVMTSSSKIKET